MPSQTVVSCLTVVSPSCYNAIPPPLHLLIWTSSHQHVRRKPSQLLPTSSSGFTLRNVSAIVCSTHLAKLVHHQILLLVVLTWKSDHLHATSVWQESTAGNCPVSSGFTLKYVDISLGNCLAQLVRHHHLHLSKSLHNSLSSGVRLTKWSRPFAFVSHSQQHPLNFRAVKIIAIYILCESDKKHIIGMFQIYNTWHEQKCLLLCVKLQQKHNTEGWESDGSHDKEAHKSSNTNTREKSKERNRRLFMSP